MLMHYMVNSGALTTYVHPVVPETNLYMFKYGCHCGCCCSMYQSCLPSHIPTLLTRRTVDCFPRNASQCLLLHDYDSVSVKVVFWCWTWFNDNLHSVPMLLPINVRVWPLFFSILILFVVWIRETRFVRLSRALRSTLSTFPVSRRFTERESRLSPRETRNSNRTL